MFICFVIHIVKNKQHQKNLSRSLFVRSSSCLKLINYSIATNNGNFGQNALNIITTALSQGISTLKQNRKSAEKMMDFDEVTVAYHTKCSQTGQR